MFDRMTWRRQIAERIGRFTRNPRQEMLLVGAPGLLSYLVAQTFEPFLAAFQREPIAAVLTFAGITRGPGADQIVRQATRMRYQSAAQIDRELRANKDVRVATEQLLIDLQIIPLVRQRLNSSREVWLRQTLERELDAFSGEFTQLRRNLNDPDWQARYDAIRALRDRQGVYTPADLVLVHDGLNDSAAHVRANAARMVGLIVGPLPEPLIKALVQVALHDCDAETRFAAARAIGALRERVISPQLLDYLSTCLFDKDSFVRSAAALVLGQLGELAGAPGLIQNLILLLDDSDPYTREAAARALGRVGLLAATSDVIASLTKASQDGEISVHEAATDSISQLREIRGSTPIEITASV